MFVLQAQKTQLIMVQLPRTAGGRLAARGNVCICFLSDLYCFMSSFPFIRIGDVKALDYLIAASGEETIQSLDLIKVSNCMGTLGVV